MHERTFDGLWWVPGGAAEPVGGRLIFSASDGLRLETVGRLVTEIEGARTARIPYVHGTIASLSTGNDITLHDVWRQSEREQGKYTQQVFTPHLALLGAHVDHTQTIGCSAGYTQLGPWLIEGASTLR